MRTFLLTLLLLSPALANAQTPSDAKVDKSAWVDDAWDSRMFYTATGRSLKAGHGYAGAIGFGLIPFVQVGVTDRLSIGLAAPVYLLTGPSVKFQVVRSRLVNAAVGTVSIFFVGGFQAGGTYANVTIGTRDSAVTGGIVRLYYRDERTDARPHPEMKSAMTVTVAAEYRFHPRLKFITENFVNKEFTLLTGGFRYIGDRWSMDFGVQRPATSGFIILPLMNVVWKFGR